MTTGQNDIHTTVKKIREGKMDVWAAEKATGIDKDILWAWAFPTND